MGLAGAGLAVAVAGLGYGVYAGQKADAAQAKARDQAAQQFREQQQLQAQQYADQQKQMATTTASNLATEAQTRTETMAAQQAALQAEKDAIGTNSTTLSNSLNAQNTQAITDQEPILEGRLNQMGLLNSGALPAQQAKYQAGLQSQAQAALANYQIGAQGQLTQNTNAASADQVNADRQNALLNIQNSEQNMSQNFQTTDINNQNNSAYGQYLTSLDMARAQSQQSAANSYTQFGAGIGSGLLSYYGQQNQQYNNPSLAALRNAGYGSSSDLGPSWNGEKFGGFAG